MIPDFVPCSEVLELRWNAVSSCDTYACHAADGQLLARRKRNVRSERHPIYASAYIDDLGDSGSSVLLALVNPSSAFRQSAHRIRSLKPCLQPTKSVRYEE